MSDIKQQLGSIPLTAKPHQKICAEKMQLRMNRDGRGGHCQGGGNW